MKRLFALAWLLLALQAQADGFIDGVQSIVAGGGGGLTYTALGKNQDQAASGALTAPITFSQTSGRLIVCGYVAYSSTVEGTIADTAGNSWTKQATAANTTDNALRVMIWTAVANGTGSTTVTMTEGAVSNPFLSNSCGEVSGQNATPIDGTPACSSGTTSPAVANIPDTTNANDVIIGVGGWTGSATGSSSGSWTVQTGASYTTNAIQALVTVAQAPGSSGAFDPAFALSGTDVWTICGIAIKP